MATRLLVQRWKTQLSEESSSGNVENPNYSAAEDVGRNSPNVRVNTVNMENPNSSAAVRRNRRTRAKNTANGRANTVTMENPNPFAAVRKNRRTNAEKRDWTKGDLHQRFVDAVNQLGGAKIATPKEIIKLMGFKRDQDGTPVTPEQVKSHLQNYRLAQAKLAKESTNHQAQKFKRRGDGLLRKLQQPTAVQDLTQTELRM